MNYRRYLAEFLGTFPLTYIVWLSVTFAMPFPTPLMAAMALGIGVYTLGGISGAHFNPAVTIGLLTIKKINVSDAAMYVIAQLLGGAFALWLGYALSQQSPSVTVDNAILIAVAEAIGAFFLAFGVTAVTLQKVHSAASGLVVGGSLLLGIYIALPFGNGILNPAVALGIGSFGAMYILGPIVGAIAGAWACKLLYGAR